MHRLTIIWIAPSQLTHLSKSDLINLRIQTRELFGSLT